MLPVLSVSKLTYAYPGRAEPVFADLGISVQAGERVALVGPSGCGKTTLLRILEGSLTGTPPVQRHGRVALVYQDMRLVDEATARENVAMGMLGSPREQRRNAVVQELLSEVGLAEFADERVSSLSGGQRRRVAIARALAARPDVLLADEPFSNLDDGTADRVAELLGRLQAHHGFALVCSVHDPRRVAKWFDRVVDVGALSSCDCAVPCGIADTWQRRRRRWDARLAVAAIALISVVSAAMLFAGAPPLGEALREAGRFLSALIPIPLSRWADVPWGSLLSALVATLQMALVGTVLGALISFPIAFVAGLSERSGPLVLLARGIANVARSVPSLLWGLIAVAILGIGPAAGVAALAAYSTGYLTRLFCDVLENADRRPAEALRQLGASRFAAIRHAVVRPSAPGLAGAALFVFEYNVRAASVLGVVGAGGIGAQLAYYLEWRRFAELSAGLALIVAVACLLDAVSRRVRRRLASARGM